MKAKNLACLTLATSLSFLPVSSQNQVLADDSKNNYTSSSEKGLVDFSEYFGNWGYEGSSYLDGGFMPEDGRSSGFRISREGIAIYHGEHEFLAHISEWKTAGDYLLFDSVFSSEGYGILKIDSDNKLKMGSGDFSKSDIEKMVSEEDFTSIQDSLEQGYFILEKTE